MASSAEDESRIERRERSEFLRDFALVASAYVFGHGLLRFFAAFLVGLNDAPRAALVERWIPLWNAIGFFVLAWGAYHFIIWSGRFASSVERRARTNEAQSASVALHPPEGTLRAKTPRVQPSLDWKAQLKRLQKRKDVPGILELQKSLTKSLSKERTTAIDRRLGRWFTKHF